MKKNIILIAFLIMSGTVLNAAAFNETAHYKTTEVKISSDSPLSVGNNTLLLDVSEGGNSLSDAKVDIKVFMPAMPGMPAMSYSETAKHVGDGKYEVSVNLSMSGTWQVHIFIVSKDGKKIRVKTSFNI